MKIFLTFIVVCLLISCTPVDIELTVPNGSFNDSIRDGEISKPEVENDNITWLSDPNSILVQYDFLGGLMGGGPGTNVPLWKLYGDGLLVWSEGGPATPGFSSQVWIGHLSEAEINELIAFISEQGFWDLDSTYQPDQFLEPTLISEDNPDEFSLIIPNPEAALDQPSSTILVVTQNYRHQVTVFPADWAGAPEVYQLVRQKLLKIKPDDSTPFLPHAFSLRAREISQNPNENSPTTHWPFDIQLSAVAEQPVTLENELGRTIFDFISSNGQKVIQDEILYIVTILAEKPRP